MRLGFCQAFQSRSDVDAIPLNVVLINHNVTDIKSYPIPNLRIFRYVLVLETDKMLHFHGASNGLDSARKLYQQAITHQFHDAAVPCQYNRLEKPFSMGFDCCQSVGFVITNEATVANYVSGKYRGETSFKLPTSMNCKHAKQKAASNPETSGQIVPPLRVVIQNARQTICHTTGNHPNTIAGRFWAA